MKFEKAKVTIINLGEQDILTCSGYTACNNWPQQPSYTSWKPKTPSQPKYPNFIAIIGGWFGHRWF